MNTFEEKTAMADQWGRELARHDMEKAAAQQAINAAGRTMAKMAGGAGDVLKSLGHGALDFAKKNPGAAVGGALGAAHGLMRDGGGVGSAVLEGTGGAALGHGAQHIAGMHGITPSSVADQVKKRFSPEPTKVASLKLAFGALGASMLAGAARTGLSAAGKMGGGSGMAGRLMAGVRKDPMGAISNGLSAVSTLGSAASAMKQKAQPAASGM